PGEEAELLVSRPGGGKALKTAAEVRWCMPAGGGTFLVGVRVRKRLAYPELTGFVCFAGLVRTAGLIHPFPGGLTHIEEWRKERQLTEHPMPAPLPYDSGFMTAMARLGLPRMVVQEILSAVFVGDDRLGRDPAGTKFFQDHG